MLKHLKDEGYELGIITNGPTEHQMQKIKSLGIRKYISRELMFVSDEVRAANPGPKIFHHAPIRVGYSLKELLYIGDSWTNDNIGSNNGRMVVNLV
ncbi:HAD-IA family hydrolase [Neobacillus sp. SM06]|uniref:HAD-IA family hydrolase n=1 Tax=Neobacillus sp. SM06 TaxID=3422492 RepID=UPI003D2814DD